jgi:hypothetical protein
MKKMLSEISYSDLAKISFFVIPLFFLKYALSNYLN